MSTECAIESPYTLLTLPRPFDPIKGKTYAEPVFGYKAQKRRKRPEVAVCVDGEGIQIYNVCQIIFGSNPHLMVLGPNSSIDHLLRSSTTNTISMRSVLDILETRKARESAEAHIRCDE